MRVGFCVPHANIVVYFATSRCGTCKSASLCLLLYFFSSSFPPPPPSRFYFPLSLLVLAASVRAFSLLILSVITSNAHYILWLGILGEGDGNPMQQAFRTLKLIPSPSPLSPPARRCRQFAFSREDLECIRKHNNSRDNSWRFCVNNEGQQAIRAIFMRIKKYPYFLEEPLIFTKSTFCLRKFYVEFCDIFLMYFLKL